MTLTLISNMSWTARRAWNDGWPRGNSRTPPQHHSQPPNQAMLSHASGYSQCIPLFRRVATSVRRSWLAQYRFGADLSTKVSRFSAATTRAASMRPCTPLRASDASHTTSTAGASTSARMDAEAASSLRYWSQFWEGDTDPFTLEDVNPNLVQFLPAALPDSPTRASSHAAEEDAPLVLVPLCGRSHDLAWLARQRLNVVGVEAVATPLRLWARDNGGLVPRAESPRITSYQSVRYPGLHLLHGDIFDLTSSALGAGCDAVWDRAALTSIPDALHERYVRHLASLCAPRGAMLFEFLCTNIETPHNLQLEYVRKMLMQLNMSVDVLKDEDVRAQYPAFRPPGLQYLREIVLIARLSGA
ncbi:hypothetical protein EON67_09490 [archaeon]|nr:MAG: hypothetical protein EON67_09490 [archaeon]